MDVTGNYSVIVENNLIGSDTNEKLNISILCPITRTGLGFCIIFPKIFIVVYTVSVNQNSRISNGVIIGLVLLVISLVILVVFITYQK
jgi:hypothetical protein